MTKRLKREEFSRTKHDSHFSKWKILVGPSDWKDYSQGKEGVSRYRVHNLPERPSPGVYELGVAVSKTNSGRDVGKLDPANIVVVYLGQADNVRTRLQRYGRSGAHLGGNGSAGGCPDDCKSSLQRKGPGLFEEILSMGYSVVYRWAPMKSKEAALKTEAQLLNTFDYAWNKGSNVERRPDVIIQKLDEVGSLPSRFFIVRRKLVPFMQKQAGVKIESAKLQLSGKESGISNFLNQVFKLNRSRPRLILDRYGENKDNNNMCGVVLSDGSVCRVPPVKGRKRCSEHKGMKIDGASSFIITKVKSDVEKEADVLGSQNLRFKEENPQYVAANSASKDFTPVCGVIVNDGLICRRQPVQGRKRCDEHKGMKVRGHILSSVADSKLDYLYNEASLCNSEKDLPQVSLKTPVCSKDNIIPCGVNLGNGSFCTKQPVKGRVRCEEHKGMRVKGTALVSAAKQEAFPCGVDVNWQYRDSSITLCGAATKSGSYCRRKPGRGENRCWQHKSM